MKIEKNRLFRWLAVLITVLSAVFLWVGIFLFFAVKWYLIVYGKTGFDSILYTLQSNLSGADPALFRSYIQRGAIPSFVVALMITLFFYAIPWRKIWCYCQKRLFKKTEIDSLKKLRYQYMISLIFIVFSCTLLQISAKRVGVIEYMKRVSQETNFFQEEYISPKTVDIQFPEQKKNLILIVLESMETTFLSTDVGGGKDIQPLESLYELAEENINFSHNDNVGGFRVPTSTTWTIAALVGLTSGIPLKTPPGVGGNEYNNENFLPGVTNLYDILHENGYDQAFMCGSDSEFAGRKQYFQSHGVDHIFDYYTAIEDSLIERDYKVWWGMEDSYLFTYAQSKLTKMAEEGPFSFTMLTADTHHVGGYRCELCGDKYEEQYDNVLKCTSDQVSEFVQWIQQQSFYADTVIVITGDHYTMDAEYIKRCLSDFNPRTVYNCFVHPQSEPSSTKNRDFVTYDIFPSIFAAIGCEIEGDRLGLGTNLFSDQKTLAEIHGIEWINQEISKNSSWYNINFLLGER